MTGLFISIFVISLVAVMIGLARTTGSAQSSHAGKQRKQSKTKDDIAWERIPDEFVIFDLETTGLKTNKVPVDIVEISAVKIKKEDLKQSESVETFTALVKPWRGGLNPDATAVNNITQRMIDDHGEDMPKVIREFMEFVGDRVLIAYNVDFDRWFLQRELKDQGISKRYQYECALELARDAFPRLKNHKLTTVAAHLGVNTAGAHRALEDCVMTMHVYLWAKTLSKGAPNSVEEQIQVFENTHQSDLVGKNIAFTGALPTISRGVAEKLATTAGMTVKAAISRKVDFVVVGDKGGAKLDKAIELQLNLISEDEFLTLINAKKI